MILLIFLCLWPPNLAFFIFLEYYINRQSPEIIGRIDFSQKAILDGKSLMHCITGVTGSGKTCLLQALASVIWALLATKDGNQIVTPDFSITLVYDLVVDEKEQTVCFRHQAVNSNREEVDDEDKDNYAHQLDQLRVTEFIVFKGVMESIKDWGKAIFSSDDEKIEKLYSDAKCLNYNNIANYLPKEFFVYTTGKTKSWEQLFSQETSQINKSTNQLESKITPLVKEIDLELAICALAIGEEIKAGSSFANILSRLNLLNSLEISFAIDLSLCGNEDKELIEKLKEVASTLIIEANSNKQYLAFGFPLMVSRAFADKLALFNQLRKWQQLGALTELTLTFNKVDEKGQIEQIDYDYLSDGEQALLGQVALFNIISTSKNTNTLLLLDEPEKPFNDSLKREMVSLIRENLSQANCSIILTTNSALPITDFITSQVTVMKKIDGKCCLVNIFTGTFAASVSEILYYVFDCKESVGESACKYLESILLLANNSNSTNVASVIKQLEMVEKQLGPGYYQLEFRRRLRALSKMVA
jgi:ABC-type hemin transport system ATPase subunit